MGTNRRTGIQEELYAELDDSLVDDRPEEQAEEPAEDDDARDPWTYFSESARCSTR